MSVNTQGREEADERKPPEHGTVTFRSYRPEFRSDRYLPQRFHARGGMGEVWLARDNEIGRMVALKRLRKERYANRERFMAEAQIAGQLEHPGIVPVHDLGVDSDDNVYYVMKFVHGQTLAAAIEDFHASADKPEFNQKLELRRLLEHLIDLCDAVAYAHSRGVIHRDIKPDNVMLGDFGETLVLDWGLAKVVNHPEMPGIHSSSIVLTSSGRSTETMDGSVMGTPAYMPPELAEGHASDVGESCDVYLLGGTLYEILTGQPPRRGSSQDEMVDMARTVSPVAPRKLKRTVPRPLEAICLKAMAKRQQDRYPHAQEFAEEIRQYLADEPVKAYQEGILARSWRWAKRHHRKIGYAISAALLMTAIAIAAVMFERARRLKADEDARVQVQEFRQLADEMFFASTNQDAPGEAIPYYDLAKGETLGQQALAIASHWGPALEQFPLEDQRPKLKNDVYDVLLLQAQIQLADATSEERDSIRDLLHKAKLLREPTRRHYELARLASIDDQQVEPETPADAPTSVLDHFLLAEELRKASATRSAPEDPLAPPTAPNLATAISEYRIGLRLDPDHYWSHLQLGRCFLGVGGRSKEAIQRLGTCIALLPDAPWAYSVRGLALGMQGDYEDALADLDGILEKQPEFLPARLNRGRVYLMQGEVDKAITEFKRILAAPEQRRLWQAAFSLGDIYFEDKRDFDNAVKYFQQCKQAAPEFRLAYKRLATIEYLRGSNAAGALHLDRFLELGQVEAPDPTSAKGLGDRGRFLRWVGTDKATDIIDDAKTALTEYQENQLATKQAQWEAAGTHGDDTPDIIVRILAVAAEKRSAKARDLLARHYRSIDAGYLSLRKLAVNALADRKRILELALDFLNRAVEKEPSAKLQYEIGLALRDLRKDEDALAAFSTGIELDPNSLRLLDGRGFLHFISGESDLSEADYEAASRAQPNQPNEQVLVPQAYSFLGCLAASNQDALGAESNAALTLLNLRNVRSNEKKIHVVFHNLACIYGEMAKSQEASDREKYENLAIQYLEQAVKEARKVGRLKQQLRMIAGEDYFDEQLKERKEFKQWLE